MTNTEKVPVGVFTLRKSPGKGGAMMVKRTLLSHLKGANVSGVQVKVRDNDIAVYGNPVISILEDFVEKSRGKVEVNLSLTDFTEEGLCAEDRAKLKQLEHDYKASQSELEISRGNYTRTQDQLGATTRDLRETKKQLGEAGKRIAMLKTRNESLEQQVMSDRVLTGDTDPEHLVGVLGTNLDIYLRNGESLIANVFAQIERDIESRTLYQETEELRQARSTLERRSQIIDKLGDEGLELLDPDIRSAQQEKWEKAETSVSDYEGKVKQMTLPVRIGLIDPIESLVITAPVNPETTHEVGKRVYGAFKKIAEEMKAKKHYAEEVEATRFATMLVRGIRSEEMIDLIKEKYNEITEETGISANPFHTPFYQGEKLDQIMTMRNESIGMFEPQPDKIYEGVGGLKDFIKDRGYTPTELSRKMGMRHPGQLYDILNGKVANPIRKTQLRIAHGLGISVSDLREMTGWK